VKINLEIIESAYIYDPLAIKELNTKELVPKMMMRRRLTRAAKIAIYLTDAVNFKTGRIVYGNNFGEPLVSANILDSILNKEAISPTHFQNSVYNTAISYLSMLRKNEHEIMTISSGDNTSFKVLKAGAIKALDNDTLLLIVTEALDIPNINEINSCESFLEAGVALKVKITQEKSTLKLKDIDSTIKIPKSMKHMFEIAKSINQNEKNIIEVIL